jgi:hypothetical protein
MMKMVVFLVGPLAVVECLHGSSKLLKFTCNLACSCIVMLFKLLYLLADLLQVDCTKLTTNWLHCM